MTAAITAAQRGFDVELWEKSDKLGGALKAAGAPKFKEAVGKYLEYLKIQLYKSNVKVQVNKTAGVDDIIKKNPDAVIIALGARPVIPEIPGMEKIQVMEATRMLMNDQPAGEKAVVLGGGIVGCEAALHLYYKGKDVTIVEKLSDVLLTVKHATNNDLAIRKLLSDSNIKIMTSSTVVSADRGKVTVDESGKQKDIPCDTLIVSVGYCCDKSLKRH